MSELSFADPSERADLGAFVARAVRLDPQAVVRLKGREGGLIDAWVATPFDVLATRTARGSIEPKDMTVFGNELLAGLAVVQGDQIDPGPSRDMQWRSALPPTQHWQIVDKLPARLVSDLADKGLAVARENVGPQGTPPASLLDQPVLTVKGDGLEVKVPLRCLFALSGMGFLAEGDEDSIRVTATDSWMRLDARYGAVVRRRHALLPLLV
ncbi:hypothetical protein SAMN05192558_103507 [Actinokineospora alba]|uniref:Uncharacterized protein n=1 Tax=Actinokineospora alba TaxID=504798 RepID=A0A1H0KJS4_9PSEU|nr:hypothetical protein [Actinokineospora alba]TDP67880.1 hypothetical protein C8E96_3436 [Actinokineospora alba]SDH88092.1 hypothetical protein SAMN05421871_102542 [Actinokineospora alba]SDO55981.1 hypothetical protein SAMN05192558_103507 [Actinokineospora alba]